MNDDITSGFVGEDLPVRDQTLQGIRELYVSKSGYSRLFRCEQYGKLHILKALQPVYVGSSFHEQALQKEFAIGYELEHPHICRTIGWKTLPELGHCILLEYVDGITLKDFMEQGLLTPELARKFITELCSALQYLHSKQIIHRDLKPSNLLITHNGHHVKLIDFSLSDCDDYEILKLPAGTRYYMAPEALQGGVTLDLRADIFSLGVMIGEMATLLNDKQLAAVSRKCTQRKREKRYASAAEIVSALQRKPKLSYRSGMVAAAVVLVLLGVGYWFGHPAQSGENIPLPVYGNCALTDGCRRMIAQERIRLNRLGANHRPTSADSVRFMQQLQDIFDTQYPLPAQRETVHYRQAWQRVLKEARTLYPAQD